MKIFVFVLVLSFAYLSFAETKTATTLTKKAEAKVVEKKKQTVCPVLGNPIDKSVYTDYKGKRIYFCCSMCVGEFKKHPDEIIKKMESEGIVLEDTPKK